MKKPITILADENMPMIREMCAAYGEVRLASGRHLVADELRDVDALLVRSVTRVDQQLLHNSPVRFVGTATIGTDHLDLAYLRQQGIAVASAPGCNADAVVDYVLTACYGQAAKHGFDPREKTWGVVGVGNVGGRLQKRLQALGCEVLLNDPPRAGQEPGFTSLDRVLAEADIICLHTPLTTSGDFPSYHLLHSGNLPRLKEGAILLNAGRGPVIDNQALLALTEQRRDLQLILDVWENEPRVDPSLAARCAVATPHIAGYSLDGKIRGSFMVCQALCEYFGFAMDAVLDDFLPPAGQGLIGSTGQSTLSLMQQVYNLPADDRALRETLTLGPADQQLAFDRLRREYPVRREFASTCLMADRNADLYRALGFRVAAAG